MIEMVTKYDKVIFILAGIGYLFNYFMTSEHIISITVRSSKNEKEIQTAALCAVTKDSERFIDEWIDYNFALGFHSIYLYDTSHDFNMNEWVKKLHSNGRQNLYLHHANIIQKKVHKVKCTQNVLKLMEKNTLIWHFSMMMNSLC